MDKYLATCVIFTGLLGAAQFFGWCFSDYSTVPDVPNTVRSNPGSYRSHYSAHYTHISGK